MASKYHGLPDIVCSDAVEPTAKLTEQDTAADVFETADEPESLLKPVGPLPSNE